MWTPSLTSLACLALFTCDTHQARLPGPRVYVVTPASHVQIDSPQRNVNYWGWRRNDDGEQTTLAPQSSHDLIFADFENGKSGGQKSVKKLLERERVTTTTTTTTTAAPSRDLIFAKFEAGDRQKSLKNLLKNERVTDQPSNIILPPYEKKNYKDDENSLSNEGHPDESPVYYEYPKVKSTNNPAYIPPSDDNHKYEYKHEGKHDSSNHNDDGVDNYVSTYHKTYDIDVASNKEEPIKDDLGNQGDEKTPNPMKVEDIWHVIDQEKDSHDQMGPQYSPMHNDSALQPSGQTSTTTHDPYLNFVFPGFSSSEEKSTENESRAINTDSNYRFPYVNLKTYQMKNKPANSKKSNNNIYTSLDHMHEIKQPVRGEAVDNVPYRGPVDRYNPAQPYLPPSPYGSNNKQSAPAPSPPKPVKTVANLIPPPPPPLPPQPAPGDFLPPPDTYESFPPYAPVSNPSPPSPPSPSKLPSKPIAVIRPPLAPPPDDSDDTSLDAPPTADDSYSYSPPSDTDGYAYKPPTSYKAPSPGYSYKPPASVFSYKPPPPPMMTSDDDSGPPMTPDAAEPLSAPAPTGYSYSKPHGADDNPDYPELVYNKPVDSGSMVKGMEMKPPPPPASDDAKPDFPNLTYDDHYKYHHDDDFDHYYHHHHHHTTTTTTTTTEMPRVNRFSYYYLGKKLYYLPLYFSVYFVIYVAALIIKAVLRHKIVYPNSWNNNYSGSGRSARDVTNPERLHEVTRLVTNALMKAAEKYTGKQD